MNFESSNWPFEKIEDKFAYYLHFPIQILDDTLTERARYATLDEFNNLVTLPNYSKFSIDGIPIFFHTRISYHDEYISSGIKDDLSRWKPLIISILDDNLNNDDLSTAVQMGLISNLSMTGENEIGRKLDLVRYIEDSEAERLKLVLRNIDILEGKIDNFSWALTPFIWTRIAERYAIALLIDGGQKLFRYIVDKFV